MEQNTFCKNQCCDFPIMWSFHFRSFLPRPLLHDSQSSFGIAIWVNHLRMSLSFSFSIFYYIYTALHQETCIEVRAKWMLCRGINKHYSCKVIFFLQAHENFETAKEKERGNLINQLIHGQSNESESLAWISELEWKWGWIKKINCLCKKKKEHHHI